MKKIVLITSFFILINTFIFSKDKWDAANENILRLSPQTLVGIVPTDIISFLKSKNYKIPQPVLYDQKKIYNVITGEFYTKGIKDWCILCSDGNMSKIIVFRNGSSTSYEIIDKSYDKNYLQNFGNNKIGYSLILKTIYRMVIKKKYNKNFNHDGIEIIFYRKASTIKYYNQNWESLKGAD